MSKYSIYDTTTGAFSRFQADVSLFVQPGESAVATDDAVDPATWSWSTTSHNWSFDLSKARARRLGELVEVSRQKVNGGVAIEGVGVVTTGMEERVQILSAAFVAQLKLAAGVEFTLPVELADGTIVELDAAETIEFGLAIAGAQGVILGRARALKAAIVASSDPDSVDIEDGW